MERIARGLILLAALIVTGFAALVTADASAAVCPPANQLTSGLRLPSKLVQTPLGNLVVAEAGTPAPNSGRLSIVTLAGTRTTLVDGLPSGINEVGDISGPSGLYLDGRTLYVAIGQGDSVIAGPIPGTVLPNPNPSSAIFSAILSLHFSARVEKTTGGFVLTAADQQALQSGARVTLSNGKGDKVKLELVVDFPDYAPNPLPFFPANVQHSNPYGLELIGDQLYVVDAGMNSVRRVDLVTGTHSTLTVFPPIPNPLPFGPPVVEAVPTSIRASGGTLLVTLFRGFPFPPGTSEVRTVDPATGANASFIAGLSSAIDVLPLSAGYLTLELSTDLLAGQPGRLSHYATPTAVPTVISDCLVSPSAMVLDAKSATLYLTEIFTGRVVSLALP